MTTALAVVTAWLLMHDRSDAATVTALLSLASSVLRLRPGWLSREWDKSMRNAREDETLFSGRRDDV